jgi:hypothetical protein
LKDRLAVAERCYSNFPEVLTGDGRQKSPIDMVFSKQLNVLREPKLSQPVTDVYCRIPRRHADLPLYRIARTLQTCAGECQVVLLSGEPGLGKSRLVATMQEVLAGEAPGRLIYARRSASGPIVPLGHLRHAAERIAPAGLREAPCRCLVSVIEGLSEHVRRVRGRAALAVVVAVGLVSLISWFGIVEAPRTPAVDGRAAGISSPTADSGAPAPTVPLSGASRQQAAGIVANESTPAPAAPAPIMPSFDIVRVEPNGDSVIAGRAAPGATIELLRNGEPYFRAPADESGAFALVPPPLRSGSHEIVLQSIVPDGTRARSRGSVTVAIADNKKTPPLVALTSPDKPTMVLSNPDPSGTMPLPQKTARAPERAGSSGVAEPATRPGTPTVGPRTEVRIVAVDAEDGGPFRVRTGGARCDLEAVYQRDAYRVGRCQGRR